MFQDGYLVSIGGAQINILPFVFESTGALFLFGWFLPIFATGFYLKGGYDRPSVRFVPKFWVTRLFLILTDDPRVLAKERGER